MLDTWGSDLVVGMFAFLLGGTFRSAMLFAPPAQVPESDRREGESAWRYGRRLAQEQADANPELPRSGWIAVIAAYGLLVVTWVSIAISPVEMRWLAFFVGAVVGWVVIEVVFRLAKRNATPGEPSSPS